MISEAPIYTPPLRGRFTRLVSDFFDFRAAIELFAVWFYRISYSRCVDKTTLYAVDVAVEIFRYSYPCIVKVFSLLENPLQLFYNIPESRKLL